MISIIIITIMMRIVLLLMRPVGPHMRICMNPRVTFLGQLGGSYPLTANLENGWLPAARLRSTYIYIYEIILMIRYIDIRIVL